MRPLPETPAPTLAPKPEAAPGTLQIVVRPWAEVSIDGAVVGTTPFRPVTLAPGSHTIALSHPEYKTLHRKVSVRSREVTRLEVDLAWEAFRR
jgi:serine/threonine-protein kinase